MQLRVLMLRCIRKVETVFGVKSSSVELSVAADEGSARAPSPHQFYMSFLYSPPRCLNVPKLMHFTLTSLAKL